jgi:hypothetical protein|uniref:Uncharacterized protein n=1 Tax=viral metagenome TaxID=1070528 RepID=A0A6C0AI71_9ZZZZ
MASAQYEDQIANGKIVVKGADVTHSVNVILCSTSRRQITTVDPRWVPETHAPQARDDYEPMPIGQGKRRRKTRQ